MLRHGFHSPEAQHRGSIQIAHSVHPEGRTPLAGGFLTGKYKRDDTAGAGPLSGANPFGNSKFVARNWDILDVLRAVAAERGCSTIQIALAWALARPGVSSIIIGARQVVQLDDSLAALEMTLTAEQMRRLDDISAVVPGFTDGLAAPAIRRMVFSGHDVRGWGE